MMNQDSPVILEIDDHRYEISNDQLMQLECHKDDESTYQLKSGNDTYRIKILEFDFNSGKFSIMVNGQVKEIKVIREIDLLIEKMGLNSSQSKKQSIVIAPMPGLVSDIKVEEDQHVEKGAPLIILEAMKMENVISAPHDAVIKSIKVKVGQAVERGLPLIEFSK